MKLSRRHGSWNCSSSSGPLGPTCDLSVIPSYPCYTSCAASSPQGDCSYLENSCDWSSCYDDVAYTEAVLYDVTSRLCVDTDQVHVSGAVRLALDR